MQEVLTVSELSQAIKHHLESRFPLVAVQGEITNFKEQSSGHLYFSLKDKDSQISAVLFRGNAARLKRMPKNGDQVVVKGEISLYMPRGSYQILVRELEFAGLGELLLRFQALKTKLSNQGWFDENLKKKLPKYPKTIGVVTSKTGAVIQDILHVLERRLPGFHLILNPVKVQGEGAAEEIAAAIDAFNTHRLADVLIVGRGGGSLEDLWAFNEEVVASAIFRSQIPVISAVGHETDFCIADFVADVRAPTPSAAAEMATSEKTAQLQFLKKTETQILFAVKQSFQTEKKSLQRFVKEPFFSGSFSLLKPKLQLLSELENSLDDKIETRLQTEHLRLSALQRQLSALNPLNQIRILKEQLYAFQERFLKTGQRLLLHFDTLKVKHTPFEEKVLQLIAHKKKYLLSLSSHIHGINPKNLLTKGYCILFEEKKDSVILSTKQLSPGSRVSIQFHDGKAHALVDKVEI